VDSDKNAIVCVPLRSATRQQSFIRRIFNRKASNIQARYATGRGLSTRRFASKNQEARKRDVMGVLDTA